MQFVFHNLISSHKTWRISLSMDVVESEHADLLKLSAQSV